MLILLLACSGPPAAPEASMDVLYLTAPAADGRPPWQLELVLPDGATDKYTAEQLIAPLIGALQPPLAECWKADELQLSGSVAVDTDLVFDGKGTALLSASPTASPLGKCVIAGFNARAPAGLPPETWRGAVRVRFTDPSELPPEAPPPENGEGPVSPPSPAE